MPDGLSIIEFSEDLHDAQAPEPLPPSMYPAECINAEARTSATSGNRYLMSQWRIYSDAFPADYADGDPDGMVLTYNRVLLEDNKRSRYVLRKFLEAVGGDLGRSFDPQSLIGKTAMLDVGTDEYEGEKRNQIKRVISA